MLGTLVKERHEGTACDDDRRDAFRLKPREFQQTGPDEENFAGRAEQVGTECVGPAKAYKEPFDSEQGKPVALEMAEIPSATNIYRHPQGALTYSIASSLRPQAVSWRFTGTRRNGAARFARTLLLSPEGRQTGTCPQEKLESIIPLVTTTSIAGCRSASGDTTCHSVVASPRQSRPLFYRARRAIGCEFD
jgi:hypothetical protein